MTTHSSIFPEVDIIPAVVTFTACLVTRLELGIVLGIAVNLLFLLYASARPAVRVTTAVVSIFILSALSTRSLTLHTTKSRL